MKESECGPCWLKATILLEPILEEAVSDYLVGVLGAGVEQAAESVGSLLCLNVFMEEKNLDEGQRQELQDKVDKQLLEFAAIYQVSPPQISWERIEDQDWSSNWKIHFRPFSIIPGLVIVPTWEEYKRKEGEQLIVLDPGMAFGTGHHGTTALSLALCKKLFPRRKGVMFWMSEQEPESWVWGQHFLGPHEFWALTMIRRRYGQPLKMWL